MKINLVEEVCVDEKCQGKGYARYLVEFAMEYAKVENVPLLFDTYS